MEKGSLGSYSFGSFDVTKYTGEIAYVPVDGSNTRTQSHHIGNATPD